MKFLAVVASVLVSAVVASPVEVVEKRDPNGVLICTGANATGECMYNTYELGKCNNLTAPYFRNTKTFAPDGGNFYCYPRIYQCGGICHSPTGCTFGEVDFGYEHKYDLSAIQWDTLISSFDCYAHNEN